MIIKIIKKNTNSDEVDRLVSTIATTLATDQDEVGGKMPFPSPRADDGHSGFWQQGPPKVSITANEYNTEPYVQREYTSVTPTSSPTSSPAANPAVTPTRSPSAPPGTPTSSLSLVLLSQSDVDTNVMEVEATAPAATATSPAATYDSNNEHDSEYEHDNEYDDSEFWNDE